MKYNNLMFISNVKYIYEQLLAQWTASRPVPCCTCTIVDGNAVREE